MNKNDYLMIVCLVGLAIFIWLRDVTWMTNAEDTLPILISLPLFIWLGWPWKFRSDSKSIVSASKLALAALLFLLGIILNMTLLLSLGWTFLLWSWLSIRLGSDSLDHVKKLLILPLMAFPWVSLDAGTLGWWFRLSGAWTTGQVFSFFGFDVKQEGTQLVINQVPISVELACAGLNTLQSMLIAGSIVAFIILGNSSRYWWNLPVLVIMAWLANTLRIMLISFAGVIVSPQFAMGAFHIWGGWLVIVIMFASCWFIFSLQETKTVSNP